MLVNSQLLYITTMWKPLYVRVLYMRTCEYTSCLRDGEYGCVNSHFQSYYLIKLPLSVVTMPLIMLQRRQTTPTSWPECANHRYAL